jgi:hypothetical protein
MDDSERQDGPTDPPATARRSPPASGRERAPPCRERRPLAGKIAEHFRAFFNLRLTRSAVCQVLLRAARRAEPVYQAVRASVRHAPSVVADETGWRIGGTAAWLHGFVTPWATVYHLDR